MKRTQILITLLLFFTVNVFSQGIVNFTGVIKDAQTGEVLEGINIYVAEKNTGTISNESGEFFFFLASGMYHVSISAEGYKTEDLTVELKEDKFSDIVLTPTNDVKKKSDGWLKRKNSSPEQVMIEKHKIKTVKNS